jgi:cytochrome c oxidase subunit III
MSGTVTVVHRDYAGAKLGMWLFLFSEFFLFGGLFILYSGYRAQYPQPFHHAGSELDYVLGTINTLVLLTSSLTMALSVSAVQKSDTRLAQWCLAATIVLAGVFLTDKVFEWSAHFREGLYPNGPELLERPHGEIVFFGLYYATTGLHGLHVLAGMTVNAVMFFLLRAGRIHAGDYIKLENAGLYWHLVDVIWIFILPLYYLAA